jgi:hypothetical protein
MTHPTDPDPCPDCQGDPRHIYAHIRLRTLREMEADPPRLPNGDQWCADHQMFETEAVREREHGGG